MAAVPDPDATFVLSTEILFNPGHAALFRPLLDDLPIRVAYYIRRQDRVLLAAWRQWGMKRGLSLPEFIAYRMNSGLPNYEATIGEWSTLVADDAFRIRFLNSRFLEGGELLGDFSAFLGTEFQGLETVGDENVSPDARLIRFLNRHSGLFETVDDDRLLSFMASARSGDGRETLRLPTNLFTLIRDRYEPRNREIVARWMPANTGLDVIDETTAPIGDAPPEPLDTEHVVARLCDIVERQGRTIEALHQRLAQLETKTGDEG